jgi:hypothetical protein
MWDAADLSALMSDDLPGYALATKSDASTVGGIFRKPYGESFGLVGGNKPRFIVPQLTGLLEGDMLTIGSVGYAVAEIEPDSTGLMALILEKA